ncbi:RecBCD enzyme subunit RecC [Candidatus Ecksteinia adelgidicola]|nr:RecBCD enzyme subunit RecC [Candidatus Ecksteinia adelgidicola]
MFKIYCSNQLNVLKILISNLINKKLLSNPLKQEVILVDNMNIAEWLQIKLAKDCSISANILFLFPAHFILDMCKKILLDFPKENYFNQDVMTWELMNILPDLLSLPEFFSLQYYLSDDKHQRKIYQLTSQISKLFSLYLIYRPHWLESWLRGKFILHLDSSQKWQALLWINFIKNMNKSKHLKWNNFNPYERLIKTLDHTKYCPPSLPSRIFIFEVLSLPPLFLKVFQAMSSHIDVFLILTSPSRYYWNKNYNNDLFNYYFNQHYNFFHQEKEKILITKKNKIVRVNSNFKNKYSRNSLLDSWGKLSYDYFSLLSQLKKVKKINYFIKILPSNMLHAVQHDIIELEDYSRNSNFKKTLKKKTNKRILDLKDHSFSIHICYSIQREIEVLHDQLLNIMTEDQDINPRNIIVMAENINKYIPYIETIFGNASTKCYLPFKIFTHKIYYSNPVLQAFISLLNLPNSRFYSKDIFALLEVPTLATSFDINEDDLSLLRRWITESGICWGLDDDHVKEFNLPVTNQHTWNFGITRMLLGYSMDSSSGPWKGILPYDDSSGLVSKLIEKLSNLLNALCLWRKLLSQKYCLKDWAPLCNQLLDTFFTYDSKSKIILLFIKNQLEKAINCGLTAHYLNKISLDLFRNHLISKIKKVKEVNHSFFSNKIIFCSFNSIHSIPFPIVCLLGINNGVYPRSSSLVNFNLIPKQPMCGDNNKRDYDRHLFLKIILSTQKRLYISSINHFIKNHQEHHPSVLVSELIEYLQYSYCYPSNKYLDDENNAQHMRKHLIQYHTRMPFSKENFIPGSEKQSYAVKWLIPTHQCIKSPKLFSQLLPNNTKKDILLDDLLRFYCHPIRSFFQMRLGVYFTLDNIKLPDEEPFTVDYLNIYQLNVQLLNALIEEKNSKLLFQHMHSAGKLPFGFFGEIFWEKQEQEMMELSKKIRLNRSLSKTLEVDIKIDDSRIIGWLNQVQEDGLLNWRPSILSAVDGILLWIKHLVYCYIGGTGNSRLYGRKDSTWCFSALTPESSYKYLSELITGYQEGLCEPLLLLNKSGWAWLNQCYQRKTKKIDWNSNIQKKAFEKLFQVWNGNKYFSGEGQDVYIQRVFRQLDQRSLIKIITSTERYLLPIAQHNVY